MVNVQKCDLRPLLPHHEENLRKNVCVVKGRMNRWVQSTYRVHEIENLHHEIGPTESGDFHRQRRCCVVNAHAFQPVSSCWSVQIYNALQYESLDFMHSIPFTHYSLTSMTNQVHITTWIMLYTWIILSMLNGFRFCINAGPIL